MRASLSPIALLALLVNQSAMIGVTTTHFHFALHREWRPKCLDGRGRTVRHRDPAPHRIKHNQHYSEDKDRHEDRIQIAGDPSPGLEVNGQKMFLIESTPAVRVVTPTKHMGTAVIQAYFCFPM